NHAAVRTQNPPSHRTAAATPPYPRPPAPHRARATASQPARTQSFHRVSLPRAGSPSSPEPPLPLPSPHGRPADDHALAPAPPPPHASAEASQRTLQIAGNQIATAAETATEPAPASCPAPAIHSQKNSPAAYRRSSASACASG